MTDPVDAARHTLMTVGTFLMPATELRRRLGLPAHPWTAFAAHWDKLAPDNYAAGGKSAVFDRNGHRLLRATLEEPGTLLLGDDRRTLHGVSPIRPRDPAVPARRDVLVVTFASCAAASFSLRHDPSP